MGNLWLEMLEPKWKEFLKAGRKTNSAPKIFLSAAEEEQLQESEEKRIHRECKMLFDIRERAVEIMKDLTFILENLPNVSEYPENDYAKIFRDEKLYINMIKASRSAFNESFKSRSKFFSPEHRDALMLACARADIDVSGERKLADRHFRAEIWDQLKERSESGKNYFQEARQQIMSNKDYRLLETSIKNVPEETNSSPTENGIMIIPDLYQKTREQNAIHTATRVYQKLVASDLEGLEKIFQEIRERGI
jgi:hypothetical protein